MYVGLFYVKKYFFHKILYIDFVFFFWEQISES